MSPFVDPHQRIAESGRKAGLEKHLQRFVHHQTSTIPVPAPKERVDSGGMGRSGLLLHRSNVRLHRSSDRSADLRIGVERHLIVEKVPFARARTTTDDSQWIARPA